MLTAINGVGFLLEPFDVVFKDIKIDWSKSVVE